MRAACCGLLGVLLVFQVKRVLIAVTATVLIATLAACGDDGGSGDAGTTAATSTSTTTVPSTSTTLDPASEVEQAYLAFHDMYTRLRETPDPDDSEIPERTTGHTRDALVSSQTTAKTLGERATFGTEGRVVVLGVDLVESETAVVRSCIVENLTITNPGGGRRGPEITTFIVDYTLSSDDGNWRVSSSRAVEKRDGQQPCEG